MLVKVWDKDDIERFISFCPVKGTAYLRYVPPPPSLWRKAVAFLGRWRLTGSEDRCVK